MSTELMDRIDWFRSRLLERLQNKSDEAKRVLAKCKTLASKTAELRAKTKRIKVDAETPADRYLIAQVAEIDQTLAKSRDVLAKSADTRLILNLEMQAIVDAVEILDRAARMCQDGNNDSAETVCRTLGLID